MDYKLQKLVTCKDYLVALRDVNPQAAFAIPDYWPQLMIDQHNPYIRKMLMARAIRPIIDVR